MIRVTDLTKDYGGRTAIHNLSFHANKGEILGFLGPNGAGKTTTMRILTGFMPPSAGKVEIGGFDVMDNSLEVRKIVGYLPETVPLYQDMTVFSYLQYMADLRHLKDSDKLVKETLARVHLEDRAHSYIEKLSKGMRQRVGLAQAILHKPEVLILDEPTIGLDPAQVVEVRKIIQEIGEDRTVLLSTHILPEAQQVCDRVLIINKGRIVTEDSPEHLQSRLTGSRRARVVVSGDPQEAVSIISSIEGVTQVSCHNGQAVDFETVPGLDLRPQVARQLVAANIDLLELNAVNLSLEDIFLHLIQEEPGDEGVADDSSPVLNEEESENA